ncbi:hypothetical protein [Streptomyces altiplanensis]
MQIEPVVVDRAGAVGCCGEKFFNLGGTSESDNGAAAEVGFTGDGPQAAATLDAFVDLWVTFAGAGDRTRGRMRPWMSISPGVSKVMSGA